MTYSANGPFNCFISRSVYEDEDSCIEAVVCRFVVNLLIRSLILNPVPLCITTKVCLIKYLLEVCFSLYNHNFVLFRDNGVVEGYYDFLSNKNIHVGISGCYKDICRKFIVTATSHYSLYFHYLRVRLSL